MLSTEPRVLATREGQSQRDEGYNHLFVRGRKPRPFVQVPGAMSPPTERRTPPRMTSESGRADDTRGSLIRVSSAETETEVPRIPVDHSDTRNQRTNISSRVTRQSVGRPHHDPRGRSIVATEIRVPVLQTVPGVGVTSVKGPWSRVGSSNTSGLTCVFEVPRVPSSATSASSPQEGRGEGLRWGELPRKPHTDCTRVRTCTC